MDIKRILRKIRIFCLALTPITQGLEELEKCMKYKTFIRAKGHRVFEWNTNPRFYIKGLNSNRF